MSEREAGAKGFDRAVVHPLNLSFKLLSPTRPEFDGKTPIRYPVTQHAGASVDSSNETALKHSLVFAIAFTLVFYATGAAFIESFVNYGSWRLIGSAEFTTYHRFIGPRVIALLVIPMAVGTVFSVLMFWLRPRAIPLWSVWAVVALQLVNWIATASIQIPIQRRLASGGLSITLIDHLIQTNWWLRRLPYAIVAALFFWMLMRVLVMHAPQPRSEAP